MKGIMKLNDELLIHVIGGAWNTGGLIDEIGNNRCDRQWDHNDQGKNTPGGNEDIWHPSRL